MNIMALGDRDLSLLTHRELDYALTLFSEDARPKWVSTDDPAARQLDDVDGIWLVPGSPYRDDATAYAAIRHCLSTGTPFLGTCAGFQYACVELVRAGGRIGADHAENNPNSPDPVVRPLACSLYGERRLVHPVNGTALAAIVGVEPFSGFHWCGFGLDDVYIPVLQAQGVVVAARAEDAGVEAIELPHHPFFMATAFQPQVGLRETERLHPLLVAFANAVRRTAME